MLAQPFLWLARQLIRWLGWPTLLSLLLLLVALGSVTLGLANIIRSFDTGLMLVVMGAGVIIGWGLARLPLPEWLAGFIILALGGEAIILRIGQFGQRLLALAKALAGLASALWRGPAAGSPDLQPLVQALTGLWAGLSALLTRVFTWIIALATGQATFDPVATTIVWSMALWLVAAWAGWVVRRHRHPLLGLTPAGVLLLTSLAHAPVKVTTAVPPLLGATLLLIALVEYQSRERYWQATGIDFSLDIRLDTTVVALFLSSALVTVATITPSLSIGHIARLAQRLVGEQVAQVRPVASSLGLESPASPPSPLEKVRIGGLPRNHLLGAGPELSEQVVMTIQTDDPLPAPANESPPRYYWRSITYDRYTGHGWFTGQTKTIKYAANEPTVSEYETNLPLNTTVPPTQRILRQEVRLVNSVGVLYAAGDLVTVDQEFSVAWRGPGDIFGVAIDAASYRAESRLPLLSEKQLRAAGSNYPDWIGQRYLRLPNELPNRVLTLARDLTATAPTPYDRAKAIESYLRTFPYTLDLPAPPQDRDVVDYFLFDLQQGYCDYYATSMVVLARAAGLPARLAVGYINGAYDEAKAHYVVTEAEAHSWPEIYFPGFGWINFEPTGGRPPLERPAETAPAVPRELEPTLVSTGATGGAGAIEGWLWWLALPGGLIILLALGGMLWSLADGWRLRRQSPATAIAMLYRRLYQHGRRLDLPRLAGDTPYEFALSLIKCVSYLAENRRWGSLLLPAAQEVRWLTELYVQTCYSPHRPALADQRQAIETWQRLRRRLWLAWLYLSISI